MTKAMFFIDGSNIFRVTCDLSKEKGDPEYYTNFIKMREVVTNLMNVQAPIDVIKTSFFAAKPAEMADEQCAFYQRLQYMGIRVHLVELQNTPIGYKEKELDVYLTCEVLKMAHHDAFDVAVLVTHDQDFIPLIRALHDQGKRVIIVGYKTKIARRLIMEADQFVDLTPHWDHLRVGKHEAKVD